MKPLDPWPACQPSVDWIFGAFERPVRHLQSSPGTVALSVDHVGGPVARLMLWDCLSREIEHATNRRYTVQPIGLATDTAHLLIVART